MLAGLACLLLTMGVGVLIGRGSGGAASLQAPATVATAHGADRDGELHESDWPAGTGSYAVYSGVFDTEAAATAARTPLAASFPDARVVRVGKDAGAAAAAGTTNTQSPSTRDVRFDRAGVPRARRPAARARLARGGRAVARGRFAQRWVTLASVGHERLAKGAYTLVEGKRVLRITIR